MCLRELIVLSSHQINEPEPEPTTKWRRLKVQFNRGIMKTATATLPIESLLSTWT